ncbi:MAG: hypothetical protein U9R07_11845 [Pseudomonadota bacterium]|nr:hypothetical protein [Pseudomonadota bacterium]
MAKKPPRAVIELQDIDDAARDGKYHFLADDALFAIGRWADDHWTYPGKKPLDFTPRYYRPATKVMTPMEAIGG